MKSSVKKISKLLTKEILHAEWIAFGILFSACSIFFGIKNISEFYYDGLWYWTIAEPVMAKGVHILNFPETFRGYFWPVLVQIARVLGENVFHNGYIGFRLLNAAMISSFFSIYLPFIFGKKVEKVSDIIRITFVFITVIYFWGDFFLYPLSDFASLYFLTLGITLIKYGIDKAGLLRNMIIGGGIGASLYAAYNTRAAYLYALMGVLVYVMVKFASMKKVKFDLLCGVAVGICLLALPQSLINYQYRNSFSPRVFTEQYSNYESGLEQLQVLWGLRYENYETYVGSETEYPSAGVDFVDEVGVELINREGLTEENFGYGALVKLFFKYPLDVTAIYMRHLISLLTPKFQETYIFNMYPDIGIMVTLIIIIWFVTLMNLVIRLQKKEMRWNLFGIALILFIPCILQLFGAPEIRFFISIHFVAYFYTGYYFDYKSYSVVYKKFIIPILVAFSFFFLLWVSVLSSILSSNQERTLLINDYSVYTEQ